MTWIRWRRLALTLASSACVVGCADLEEGESANSITISSASGTTGPGDDSTGPSDDDDGTSTTTSTSTSTSTSTTDTTGGGCGNGILEPGEQCDNGDLNGSETNSCRADCANHRCGDAVRGPGEGCDDGGPTNFCTAECRLASCGDGIEQDPEECDLGVEGNRLDGPCPDCFDPVCGDTYVQEGVEACDRAVNLSCPVGEAGTITCNEDCMAVLDLCSLCGDGVIEHAEQCDGTNFNGQTCADFGFAPGMLDCTELCIIDTTPCVSCGNDTVEPPEDCDGAVDPTACNLVNPTNHPGVGTLACSAATCEFDETGCLFCGDGILTTPPEACEAGVPIIGTDCSDMLANWDAGTLACAACQYDESECCNNVRGSCETDAQCCEPGNICGNGNTECCLADGQACTSPGETFEACCSGFCVDDGNGNGTCGPMPMTSGT